MQAALKYEEDHDLLMVLLPLQAALKYEEITKGLRDELAETQTKAEVATERAEVAEQLVAPLKVHTSLLRAEVRAVEREKIAAVDSLM